MFREEGKLAKKYKNKRQKKKLKGANERVKRWNISLWNQSGKKKITQKDNKQTSSETKKKKAKHIRQQQNINIIKIWKSNKKQQQII